MLAPEEVEEVEEVGEVEEVESADDAVKMPHINDIKSRPRRRTGLPPYSTTSSAQGQGAATIRMYANRFEPGALRMQVGGGNR